MWTKTLKGLNDRLADSLKPRLKYNFENKHGCNQNWAMQFMILVDKEQWMIQNNLKFWHEYIKIEKSEDGFKDLKHMKIGPERCRMEEQYVKDKLGYTFLDDIFYSIHLYLNRVDMKKDFKKLVDDKDYYLILFGILDRRLGKRTFEWIYDNIDKFPEWLHKFIDLRVECEGWEIKKKVS